MISLDGIDRLKAQLLASGVQQENFALYQVINQLIQFLRDDVAQNIAAIGSGGSGGGGLLGASYLTKNPEPALPNSRQTIAGAGIEFNDAPGGRRVIQTALPLINDGEDGEPGFQGPPGTQGPRGFIGPMGPPGRDAECDEPFFVLPNTPVEIDPRFFLTQHYGFIDNTQTTIAFDGTNTVSLNLTGANFQYFRTGVLCTIRTNQSVVIPGAPIADGVWFIYIDSTTGALIASLTPWTLLDTKVPVAILYFRNAATPKYWLADERHTCLIDRKIHYYEHFSSGAKVISGGLLSGYVVAPAVPVDTDNTFGISEAVLLDEDLRHVIAALADPGGAVDAYEMFYRTALTTWTWDIFEVPFKYTGAGYIEWDNAGTMTAGASGNYYTSYLVFTNLGGTARQIILSGRGEYASLAAAQAESINSFDLSSIGIVEWVVGWKFIWRTLAAYGTRGKCRLEVAPIQINVSLISSSASTSAAHNLLPGLQGGLAPNEYYHLDARQYAAIVYGQRPIEIFDYVTDEVEPFPLAGGVGTLSFTPGSVIFAGTNGLLAQNNANFFWDDATAKLIFGGDANLYRSAANILKTDDSLLVVGSITANANITATGTGVDNAIGALCDDGNSPRLRLFQTNHASWYLYNPPNSSDLRFYDDTGTPGDRFTFTVTGRLGINTTSPAARLEVDAQGDNCYLTRNAGAADMGGFQLGITGSGTADQPEIIFQALDHDDAPIIECLRLLYTGGVRMPNIGAFAAGDKYLVIDASGNLHISTLGPAA